MNLPDRSNRWKDDRPAARYAGESNHFWGKDCGFLGFVDAKNP